MSMRIVQDIHQQSSMRHFLTDFNSEFTRHNVTCSWLVPIFITNIFNMDFQTWMTLKVRQKAGIIVSSSYKWLHQVKK